MNMDDIRKMLDRALAERMRISEEELFGSGFFRPFSQQQGPPRYGFSGFRDGQNRMAFPDDGKTITLGKDDYRVVEEGEG